MNESDDFEIEMIRMRLTFDPENEKLSPEELDKLVAEEYKASKKE
ncbi:MAG TPA: hypothetical protein VJ926_03390 [Patescibacteria group bacterium]|nr:hypothetical protein [Patescibacteria group bacterium]